MCSVSLTMTTTMTTEIKEKIELIFSDQQIGIIDFLQSHLSLNLFISSDDRAKAILALHDLITLE